MKKDRLSCEWCEKNSIWGNSLIQDGDTRCCSCGRRLQILFPVSHSSVLYGDEEIMSGSSYYCPNMYYDTQYGEFVIEDGSS